MKVMKKIAASTILLAAIAMGQQAHAAEKVSLAFKLPKGSSYDVEMVTNQTTQQDIPGRPMKNETKMTMTMRYDAVKVENGVTTIKITYKSMAMDVNANGMKLTGDSVGDDKDSMLGAFCHAVVDKSIEADVEPNGNVKKVAGGKKFIETCIDAITKSSPDAARIVVPMLEQMFSDAQLAQMLSASMHIYPDNPVAPGDNWVIKSEIQGQLAMAVEGKFDLKSIKDGVATVKATGGISTLAGGIKVVSQGTTVKIEMEGEQKGTILMNVATGALESIELEQSITGNVEARDAAGRGAKWPMLVESKSTVKMKPVK